MKKNILIFFLLVLSLGIVKFTWTLNIDVTKEPTKKKDCQSSRNSKCG